eukprot:1137856-Ditylum_brightwellii.AAC.2
MTDGTRIHPALRNPTPMLLENQKIKINWPIQSELTPLMWKTWQTTLYQVVCNDHGYINQPLGHCQRKDRMWHNYLNTKFNMLFVYNNESRTIHHFQHTTRKFMEFYSNGHHCPFPCIQRHTIILVTDVQHHTAGTIICT